MDGKRAGGRLRRLDERVVGGAGARCPGPRRPVLTALLLGLLAAGLPTAYVLREGGSPLVAALLPLLGLVPVVLVLLLPRDGGDAPG